MKLKEVISPPVLFLVSLPFLAIIGGQLVRIYNNNIILMILLCLVAVVPLLAIVTKLIPERLYPLAIYCSALALLLHAI
jgi:uncharacterized membrane protein